MGLQVMDYVEKAAFDAPLVVGGVLHDVEKVMYDLSCLTARGKEGRVFMSPAVRLIPVKSIRRNNCFRLRNLYV